MAEADRGRHPGFPRFNVLAGGPRQLSRSVMCLMPDLTLKDRFWSFGRDTEVSHVNGLTERSGYRQLCYAVIDAVIEIRDTGEIRPEHIEAFAKAAECSFEFVFCCGGKRLMTAAHFSPLAADALRALATHVQWRPRFNVMCLMGY